MQLDFYKYHGAGNDFILIDNRKGHVQLSNGQVAFLCNRHIGIGADGLMLLESAEGYDFKMVYYNSDGNESTMCGNGGRCITAFARQLDIIDNKAVFRAIDGAHEAFYTPGGLISLHMQDVNGVEAYDGYCILNTGSPHYVKWIDDVQKTDVVKEGRTIRNEERFQPKGINVNFVQRLAGDKLWIRTYERGVEDETLSCGTGVTAGAIAATGNKTGSFNIQVQTPGGDLQVSFNKSTATSASNVILTGPVVFVFEGRIEL
jgi:diaminopimelate epimerase